MRKIPFLLLLALTACFKEDKVDLAKPATFTRFYSDGYANQAVAVEQTEDGGFIILANSTIANTDAETPRNRIVLIKTDAFGQEEFREYHPDRGTEAVSSQPRWVGNSLSKLPDGGYLIAGYEIQLLGNEEKNQALILTTNAAGMKVQSHVFTSTQSAQGEAAIHRTVNGQQRVLALFSSEEPNEKMILRDLNLNALGQVKFQAARGDFYAVDLANRLNLLISGSDTTALFGGSATFTEGNPSDLMYSKFTLGNSTPSAGVNFGESSLNEEGADYCIVGSQIFFIGKKLSKLSENIFYYSFFNGSSGSNIDSISYLGQYIKNAPADFGSEKNETGISIAPTHDGNLITLSTIDSYPDPNPIGRGDVEILIMKITQTGDIIFSETYGSLNADNARMVRQTSDRGYIILGNSRLAGVETILLIKTDENGQVD